MDHELDGAVVVEFPLRGERWVAVTTPGDRIPSHGVDMLGQGMPMTCSRWTSARVCITTRLARFVDC